MKQRQKLPHFNNSIMIKAKYKGATDYSGACFYLSTNDLRPFTNDREKSIRFSYSYEYDSAYSDALKTIVNAGLKVLAVNTNNKGYEVFICKWNEESFKKLAKLFKVEV